MIGIAQADLLCRKLGEKLSPGPAFVAPMSVQRSVPTAACQFPVGQAPWLVVDSTHHAAPLQGQQRAVDPFGHHRPASMPAGGGR